MQKFILFVFINFFSTYLFSINKNELTYYKYLIIAQSLEGPTGNIETPSVYVLPYKSDSISLHRFDVGAVFGIYPDIEIGAKLDLRQLSSLNSELQKWPPDIIFHSKYQGFKQPDKFMDLSIGLQKEILYMVTNRQFQNFFNTNFQPGVDYYSNKFDYFFAITYPTKYSCFIFDYKNRTGESNFGWRVLLSPYVKLDLFLVDLPHLKTLFYNFLFGVTFSS